MTTRVHATAVAIGGRAVLLIGPSGSGKSDLALRLIDRGATLIADDQVELRVAADGLFAAPPPRLAGLIEVRGVGIVRRAHASGVPVALVIDLAAAPERLPEATMMSLAGIAVPRVALAVFAASAPLAVEAALTRFAARLERAAVASVDTPPADLARDAATRVVVVTGMSGAGKSVALKALEDLGYEAVDNLPLALFDRLLDPVQGPSPRQPAAEASPQPLAIGIDSRTRGFDADAIVARLAAFRAEGLDVRLLFLDCSGGELTRRFSETRRRHPLALDRPAADGIAAERELLGPLRRWADAVVDTTDTLAAGLRTAIVERFGAHGGAPLTLTCTSFGFARGLPRDADLVFDMRFLHNPHWDPALRPLTGEDERVAEHVAADPAFAPAFERIVDLLLTLLPGYGREGKAYLTIAFGCTGGRHRSVFVARAVAAALTEGGYAPHLVHRDIGSNAQGADAPAPALEMA